MKQPTTNNKPSIRVFRTQVFRGNKVYPVVVKELFQNNPTNTVAIRWYKFFDRLTGDGIQLWVYKIRVQVEKSGDRVTITLPPPNYQTGLHAALAVETVNQVTMEMESKYPSRRVLVVTEPEELPVDDDEEEEDAGYER